MIITSETLHQHGACPEGVLKFRETFPEGVKVPESSEAQIALILSYPIVRRFWGWAVASLIIPALSMHKADLSGADLNQANLRWADLNGADLSRASLRWADLSRANLREANLREADLRGVNLREANLNGANLSRANLRLADLSGANLREANLREADLRGANLRGADLRGAYGVTFHLEKKP